MRKFSTNIPFVPRLAAIFSVFAVGSAWAAEVVVGDKPARNFAAIHAVSSISAPRPEVARSALRVPIPAVASVTAPVSPMLQSATDAFNRISLASMHLQGDLLGWAIASGNDRMVDWMLHFRVNPNVSDSGGTTPLLHAVVAEDLCLTGRLLDLGAEPDAAGPQQVTPSMMAASSGNAEMVEALLEGGAQVDAADANGRRPIHYAITARKQ